MRKQSIWQEFREKVRESEINIRLFLIVSSCFSYVFLFLMIAIGSIIAIIFNNSIGDNENYHVLYEQIKNPQNYELIDILSKYILEKLFILHILGIIFFPVSIKEIALRLEKCNI